MSDKATVKYATLLSAVSVAQTSSPYPLPRGPTSYQATVTTTSTGASAVIAGIATVQVSNDNSQWIALGTLTSTGSGSASDAFGCVVPYSFCRILVTSLTTGIAAAYTAGVAA